MRLRNLSLTSLALSVCSVSAFATPIVAGGTGTPSAIAAGSQGTFITSTGNLTATAPTFTATYNETIYQGGVNALCPTCYAIAVTVTDNTATDPIEFINLSAFGAFQTNVDYVTGSGAAPTSATRTGTGNTVSYTFGGGGFGPGTSMGATTDQLIIFTNATAFANTGFLALQDQTNVSVGGFMPSVATTPEPSSLALLGTGMLGVAGAFRRRFKK